jgi:hypothetical protein
MMKSLPAPLRGTVLFLMTFLYAKLKKSRVIGALSGQPFQWWVELGVSLCRSKWPRRSETTLRTVTTGCSLSRLSRQRELNISLRKPLTLILLYQRNVDQSECQLQNIQSKSIIYYQHYTNHEQTAVHCAYVNKQNPNPKTKSITQKC